MRYADKPWRSGLAAVMFAGLAGCASLPDPFKLLSEPTPVAAAATPVPKSASVPEAKAAAAAAVIAAAPPKAPAPVVDTGPEVSPTLQRTFDEARRALRAGHVEDAELGFRALIKSNPELGGAHANLGLILRHAGKLPEAVAEFEQAVQASPLQPVYFNQLGVTYRQNGQFTKARDAYERAIELAPEYAAPHLNLGILHDLYLGDGKRALELYGQYLVLSPSGDTTVTKWVADLKNRKTQHAMLSLKEQE